MTDRNGDPHSTMHRMFHDKSLASRTSMASIFTTDNTTTASTPPLQQQQQQQQEKNDNAEMDASRNEPASGVIGSGGAAEDRRELLRNIPTLKILGKMLHSIKERNQLEEGNGAESTDSIELKLGLNSPISKGGRGDGGVLGGAPAGMVDELDMVAASSSTTTSPTAIDAIPLHKIDATDSDEHDVYVHAMTDTLQQELNEFLSQTEVPLFVKCQMHFMEHLKRKEQSPWSNLDCDTQWDLVDQWLDRVDSCGDFNRQSQTACTLLHLALGGVGESKYPMDDQISHIRAHVEMLFDQGALPIFMRAFKLHVRRMLNGDNTDDEQEQIDNVNLFANLFYIVLCVATENTTQRLDEVISLIFDTRESSQPSLSSSSSQSSGNFVQYLINLLKEAFLFEEGKSAKGYLLPMKKIACLLWKCLLLILGPTESPTEKFQPGPDLVVKVNESVLQSRDMLWQRQMMDGRGMDTNTVTDLIDSNYDHSGYPKSLKEALRIFHTTQISDHTRSGTATTFSKTMQESNESSEDPILDNDITKELPRILQRHPSNGEQLYQQLLPQLPEFVLLNLRLFLGTTDHCFTYQSSSPSSASSSSSLKESPTFNDVPVLHHQMIKHCSSSTCFRRYCQVMIKATVAIVHLLLKHFKKNHIVQYMHTKTLFCDANTVILLLNFLNRSDMDLYVDTIDPIDDPKNNVLHQAVQLDHDFTFEEPVMTPKQQPHKKKKKKEDKLSLIDLSSNKQRQSYNWRNMFTLISVTSVLEKLAKNNPLVIRALLHAKAPNILKKPLLKVEQRLFRLYALKVVKSCVKFMDTKWRKSNLRIINMIHFMTQPTLVDDWLGNGVGRGSTAAAISTQLEGPQVEQRDEKLREHIAKFNHFHYERWWEHLNNEPLLTDLSTHGDKMLYLPEYNFVAISRLQSLYNAMDEPSTEDVKHYLRQAYPPERYPLQFPALD